MLENLWKNSRCNVVFIYPYSCWSASQWSRPYFFSPFIFSSTSFFL